MAEVAGSLALRLVPGHQGDAVKQVLIRRGKAIVANVPAPAIGPGDVLVRVAVSCLSVGTEMSGVQQSALPLWRKAVQNRQSVGTAVRMLRTIGPQRTLRMIRERHQAASATGYSAAGVVSEVGSDIRDLAPGDRVACAGAQYAHHAELIRVPRNLCVRVPAGLDMASAASVTLGAIALQGVRRAQPTLGETFVVLGLGVLGQLTVQLLRAAGSRVIGIELDRSRLDVACQLGMNVALAPEDVDSEEQVARLTEGVGADGVIITAASSSDAVVSAAFGVCRKKGRVVLVGDVGLHLNRADFYAKEIDFLVSSSYGPGRYDHRYEEQGLDYPLPFVRWTENRNMGEYLKLLEERRVRVEPLVSATFPISEAEAAYAALSDASGTRPLMVLLSYPDESPPESRSMVVCRVRPPAGGRIRVAVVGVGSFARSAHLPNLRAMGARFELRTVVGRTGPTALAVAEQFGATYASTDFNAVLADPDVDAVIIATRHHLHASMALAALKAGKHVLVEKPLALDHEGIEALDQHISTQSGSVSPVLLTGFNRRFSPYAQRLREAVSSRTAPFLFAYRMNAGFLPADHWVHGAEGGGRNIGEACHIYDLCTFLADSPVSVVSAHTIVPDGGQYLRNDNFVATLTFSEGSVASLVYSAMGAQAFRKEGGELFVDGKVVVLDDYRQLITHGSRVTTFRTKAQDKGLHQELRAFADAIESGEWPIPWWQQRQVAKVALAVEEAFSAPHFVPP